VTARGQGHREATDWNGHLTFETDRKSKSVEATKDRKIEQLESKLQRKNEVLAELMAEHVQLKKELGEP
jgi:hypothetical protein